MNRSYGWIAGLALLALGSGPAGAQSELQAYYQDDFVLETQDRAYQLKIRGNLHQHGAHLAHEATLGLSWTVNPMVRLILKL